MIPVILCGGSGTRLWPLSREAYPKQFLNLSGEHSLLQATALRLATLDGAQPPLVVCNEAHRFLVAQQLTEIGRPAGTIVLEPCARNTAPALAAAALHASAKDPAALLLVLPSDHAIADVPAFAAAVRAGVPAAQAGALVTFGITPTHPATGFGYVRVGPDWPDAPGVHAVAQFVEKPDAARAEQYLQSGEYLWNGGMFLLRADACLRALEQHAPALLEACRAAVEGARQDLDFLRLDADAFSRCQSISIDYAIMERTDRAATVPLNAGWSDVGSWDAVGALRAADADGNVAVGDVLLEDARNSIAYSEGRLLALVGVDDLVAVESADAVLVARRDRAQDVRAVVERLRERARSESAVHRRVYRPWGSYEGLITSERFQVKRIVVHPGAGLSLQLHHHRAEHWTVVRGTARVTRDAESFLLHEDESTYIPLGTAHRLENPGLIPLEIIEVQTGSYLGEDDIVRLDDRYGRTRPSAQA
jgi:mannose-1-phosphate guanylyltransferase / mannose-6-phosphate isomerase